MSVQAVRLSQHDSRWRQEFLQTRSSILWACEGSVTDVTHVGSTAIAGVVAEPIIDVVAVVAESSEIARARTFIQGLNFRVAAPVPWAADVITLCKSNLGLPSHRVFLATRNNPIVARMNDLTDRIARDAGLCSRLENAKVHHWRAYEGDRQRYEQAKSIFFTHLLDQIEAS